MAAEEGLNHRLLAYARTQDFRQPPIILSDELHNNVDWPKSGYQQLMSDHRIFLSKLTSEQIDEYFLYRLAGDRQASGDIKALQKGQDLYKANRVSCNYKIKISRISGSPVNSDCECPAGKGPHSTCKHIAAVLLMLQTFCSTGKAFVEKSCTQDLQTFHQPKSYYDGAPVKAEHIPSKRKLKKEILSDPRPSKYRNNPAYSDYVRNSMINYCSLTSHDIAMRYLLPRAHIQIHISSFW